jgi:hypothetical protein
VAESRHVSLDFSVTAEGGERAGIGERLAVPPDTPVTVRLEVSGAPRCAVRFLTDQGLVFTDEPLPGSGTGTVEWRTSPARAAYVRAEVRHETAPGPVPGAMAAFTNPVFLGAVSGGWPGAGR